MFRRNSLNSVIAGIFAAKIAHFTAKVKNGLGRVLLLKPQTMIFQADGA